MQPPGSRHDDRGGRAGGRAGFWIGCLLLAHFVFLAGLKVHRGIEDEMLWISHASLLLAGLGFLIGSRLCVSTALVSVFGLHTIWLIDAASLAATGHSPLGATAYLSDADTSTWIATAHHFYLLPLLLITTLRERAFRMSALPVAAGVFAFLVIVSRLILPPGKNINGAHQLLPAIDLAPIKLINEAPGPLYVVLLVGGVTMSLFMPAAIIMSRWASPNPSDYGTPIDIRSLTQSPLNPGR